MEKKLINSRLTEWYALSDHICEIGRKVLLYNEEAFCMGENLLGFDWLDVIGMCKLLGKIDIGCVTNPTLIDLLRDIRTLASKIACIDKDLLDFSPEKDNDIVADENFKKAESYWEKGAKEEAVKCYERAGRYGHPWAYITLGNLVRDEDIQKAMKYYQLGASEGIGDCEFALGLCYRDGAEGLKPNTHLAFKWIRKAALHETCNAGNALGECFEKGWGCEKNLRKALYWYDISQTGVENGDRIREMLKCKGEKLPLRLDGFDYGITHYNQDTGWWENYYLENKMLLSITNGKRCQ